MQYPDDRFHNPRITSIRPSPRAKEFDCGFFTDRKGKRLFYREWGKKDVPDAMESAQTCIIHCHGITSHSEMCIQVADGLVRERRVVFGLDFHGHGHSDGKRGDYTRFMDFIENLIDFKRFLEQKYPQKDYVLSGESMGALVVALTVVMGQMNKIEADLGNVKKLIFWAPAFAPNFEFGWGKEVGFGLKFAFNLFLKEESINVPVDHSKTFKNSQALELHNTEPRVLKKYSARYLWKVFQAMNKLKEYGFSQNIPIPFIIIHGTSDKLVSQPASRDFFEASPIRTKCKYIKLHDVWHHLYSDSLFKQNVWEKVDTFLRNDRDLNPTHR